jgi:hypothetical protein
MKNVHTNRRAGVRLAILACVVTSITACDRLPTNPDSPSRIRSPGLSRYDETDGDSTACLGGWIILDGKAVCTGKT